MVRDVLYARSDHIVLRERFAASTVRQLLEASRSLDGVSNDMLAHVGIRERCFAEQLAMVFADLGRAVRQVRGIQVAQPCPAVGVFATMAPVSP